MERACKGCGEVFTVPPQNRRKGRGKYCTRSCFAIVNRQRLSEQDVTGSNNPNWKGGVSKNHYRYKLRQAERYPERVKARVAAGRLLTQPCEVCGDQAQAHHDDYGKPLEVRWLCRAHHMEAHNGLATGPDRKAVNR